MKTLNLLLLGSLIAFAGCGKHNVREGGECRKNRDCVKPLACGGGACVRQKHSSGGKCAVDADCAGVMRCIDFKCQ